MKTNDASALTNKINADDINAFQESIKLTSKDIEKLELILGREPSPANILLNFPINYETSRRISALSSVPPKSTITIKVQITAHSGDIRFGKSKFSRRRVYNIFASCMDGTPITLIFFKIFPYQIQQFAEGKMLTIKGRLEESMGQYKMSHPAILNQDIGDEIEIAKKTKTKKPPTQPQISMLDETEEDPKQTNEEIKAITPIYGMQSVIKPAKMLAVSRYATQIASNCINNIGKTDSECARGECTGAEASAGKAKNPASKIDLNGLMLALSAIHNPQKMEDIVPNSDHRNIISYHEFFAFHVAMNTAINNAHKSSGQVINGNGELRKQLTSNLKFNLTNSQNKVLNEIFEDQGKPDKMFRLLQGDVGSGKTVVSLMAALNAIECGACCIIMVPTTILATQHFKTICENTFGMNLRVELLTNKTTAKSKQKIMERLAAKEIDILIGTHAIIYQKIPKTANVGLFVIDEQHRFGVNQRKALFANNKNGDILMMTATPIPRTMAIIAYSGMEISIIDEKPKHRLEIDTRVISMAKYNEIVQSLHNALAKKEKIYWVCPAVEENEESDLASIEKRYEEFYTIFKDDVGMVHGKMKSPEKDEKVRKFATGEYKILIATSVIEVGIDVSDATIIVIENAEMFGLFQLHQLRGRVGRGVKQSYCILLHSQSIGTNGRERLKVIKDSNDGFVIAKRDLEIRGHGNVIGVQQSGMLDFRVSDPITQNDIFIESSHDATHYINSKQACKSVTNLLNIFGYGECDREVQG